MLNILNSLMLLGQKLVLDHDYCFIIQIKLKNLLIFSHNNIINYVYKQYFIYMLIF
jgi:hypothetical protein